MFESLRATNFRGFADTGNLNLSKLNVFIGPNSSGKSSLVRIPVLLKQTFDDPNADNCLLTDGPLMDLGSFQDVIFGHDLSRSISFNVSFSDSAVTEAYRSMYLGGRRRPPSRFEKDPPKSGSFEFAFSKRRKRIYVRKFEVRLANSALHISGECSPAGKLVHWDTAAGPQTAVRVSLFHFVPDAFIVRRGGVIYPEHRPLIDFMQRTFVYRRTWQETLRNLIHFEPIRYTLKPNYKVTGESPMHVGPRGENLLGVLFRDEKRPAKQRKRLLSQLDKWLDRKFGFVHGTKLEPITKDRSIYALTGFDCRTGIKVNLSMVGFGISQVAPIIVQGFLSEPDSCFVIEQPEIHLHPAAQAELGDLLIEFASQGKQLLIETHSEHLLLRIRNRIAHGSFPASDVRIFYVHETETGSQVQPLEMDSQGRIGNWPKGFFEEDYKESASIAEALVTS